MGRSLADSRYIPTKEFVMSIESILENYKEDKRISSELMEGVVLNRKIWQNLEGVTTIDNYLKIVRNYIRIGKYENFLKIYEFLD